MSRNLKDGVFYYGDNLPVLRDLPDESVDLIYLDPPFNSNVNYNAVFKDESGKRTDAQVKAFDDTWRWGASAQWPRRRASHGNDCRTGWRLRKRAHSGVPS